MPDLIQPEKPPENMMEMGSSLLPYSSWSAYANSYEVRNAPIVSLDNLVQMRRRDGQARAIMQLVTLPLRYALQNGHWEAPLDDEADDEVAFAEAVWSQPAATGGMTTPKNKLIAQMLLSVTDGFAGFEIVYRPPTKLKNPILSDKITLQKLAYRDPRTVFVLTDDKGGYNGFRQRANTPKGVIDVQIPIKQSILFTAQGELNPYYGVSFFESAYPHFDAKRKLYYIAHLAAQFAAVPGRIGTVPEQATAAEIAEFKRALADFAFNTAMVKRASYVVEDFKGSANFDFIKLIDHHNTMMAKSVLAQFFSDDKRTVLIENTKQDASADLFLLCMETVASDLAETLSAYLMPQLIDWNFGSGKYPRFVPGKLSDSTRDLIIDMFKTFAVASVMNATPELIREMEKRVARSLDINIDYDEIANMEQQQAEADLQAQKDQMQQQADLAKQQADGAAAQGAPAPGAAPPAPKKQTGTQNAAPPGETVKLSMDIDELVMAAERLFDVQPTLGDDL